MRANLLRTQWEEDRAVVNGWLVIPSSFTAEVLAHQGFDSLTVDMQHGLMGYETAVAMLQSISSTATVPIVRVPWNEPGAIMRMCDAGAYAIICPMVNTRAQCEAFVGACRYPPLGYRSYGPVRARVYAGGDYVAEANSTLVTFAMIETAEAVANLDEILSVPGLDAIYVGPADLSQSLGRTQRTDYTDPDLLAVLDTILAACRRHNIVAGIHCASSTWAEHAVELGFRFVTLNSDLAYLESNAAHALEVFRDTTVSHGGGPY